MLLTESLYPYHCGCGFSTKSRITNGQPAVGHTGTICDAGHMGGLNWSGVDPPLSSSRACLTTFIAISVP